MIYDLKHKDLFTQIMLFYLYLFTCFLVASYFPRPNKHNQILCNFEGFDGIVGYSKTNIVIG